MAITFDRLNKHIVVGAPTTEVTVQQLLNAIRDYEDELSNLDIHYLADAYGKQPLGGDTYVGITLVLLDGWLIKFEDRLGPDYISCKISGGNILAYDEFGVVRQDPVTSSDFVFVTYTSSSSATLTEQASIQYASFNGGVTIDILNGEPGTSFPHGTPQLPVDNLADAMTIATTRGFPTIFVVGDLVVDNGGDYSGMQFIGTSTTKSHITIDPDANVLNCEFFEATIDGTLDGNAQLRDCRILDLNYINGVVESCLLGPGTIVLGGGSEAHFIDCWSGIATDVSYPTIDCGGTGQTLAMRNYNGEIKIINKTGPENITIDLVAGKVILDSTVTDGDVVVRGIGTLIDNSTANTVDSTTLLNSALISETVYQTVGEEIQRASFADKICLDVIDGEAGTSFPHGTAILPVNNIEDAVAIAAARGIKTIHIHGDYTFGATVSLSHLNIRGDGREHYTLTFTTGCILAYCTVENAECTGASFGIVHYERCSLTNYGSSGLIPSSAHVVLIDCVIGGNMPIPANYTGRLEAINCSSDNAVPADVPTIDFNGNGMQFIIRNFSGCIMLKNCTNSAAEVALDVQSAGILIDSSCTAGTILARGVGMIVNNSSLTINDYGFISNPSIASAAWDSMIADHLDAGSTGKALSDAGSAGNPWGSPITGNTSPGTFGELVAKKLLKFATWIGLK